MGALIYFRTLCKNCYKTQTCKSIASIFFGTNEKHVTVDSRTKFAVNTIYVPLQKMEGNGGPIFIHYWIFFYSVIYPSNFGWK